MQGEEERMQAQAHGQLVAAHIATARLKTKENQYLLYDDTLLYSNMLCRHLAGLRTSVCIFKVFFFFVSNISSKKAHCLSKRKSNSLSFSVLQRIQNLIAV